MSMFTFPRAATSTGSKKGFRNDSNWCMCTSSATGIAAVLMTSVLMLSSCAKQAGAQQQDTVKISLYHAFGDPQRVTIRGYSGEAMEPFISRDGQYLLFNNRNDPGTNTDLHVATRIDDLTFKYQGPVRGANSMDLDAVASMDRDGNLFFISPRDYAQTQATLYRSQFKAGTVTKIELVPDISLHQAGIVIFDAEIAEDGNTLLVVDGKFTGGPNPKTADIVVASRDGQGFHRLPESAELLKQVNTEALEYAPTISADLLELFFTRLENGVEPAIYRAARNSTSEAFGTPQKVAGISNFVEGPSLSTDGNLLYYHALENGRYAIYRVTR